MYLFYTHFYTCIKKNNFNFINFIYFNLIFIYFDDYFTLTEHNLKQIFNISFKEMRYFNKIYLFYHIQLYT